MDSPIISPNLDSKPAISRTRSSTLIPRGFHGDRKKREKLITSPFPRNNPRSQPYRNRLVKKKTQIVLKVPRRETGHGKDERG